MAATGDATAVRRVTASAVAGLAALALASGCGGDAKPKVPMAEAQVRTVVQRFGTASAGKDYQEICHRLIAKALAQNVESLGLPCELAFKQGLGDVQGARLRIDGVRVRGATAYVDVHSTATNQAPSDDTLKLVRAAGAWRIASLSVGAGPESHQPVRP
jgi:hypothetical protein